MDVVTLLVRSCREGLAELADPVKAATMRAYMKSEMPFRGVRKPGRRTLLRTLLARHPLTAREDFETAVRTLWREAEYREERYIALDLTGQRRYSPWLDPKSLPLHEEMIVTGAWWDFVDEIASRRIGPLLRAEPAKMAPLLRRWSRDGDRWRRRASVICQLMSRSDTDTRLLADTIEANIDDPDFFLRKGIGWALRQHAKIDPDWVREFVHTRPGLSTLSRREALKHL